MTDLLTEFTDINPAVVHLVGTSANGFPAPLMAKAALGEAQTEALVKEFVDGLCGERGCAVCKQRFDGLSEEGVEKAKLKAKERKDLPDETFAGPDRSYPIEDKDHARNALSRVSQFGTSKLKARVRAAVHRKYPTIGEDDDTKKQTAPDKAVPTGEGESQTRDHIEGSDPATGAANESQASGPGTGEKPSETTGQGDTAPDKAVPSGDAASQTHSADNQGETFKTNEVDGTGDKAPNGDAAAAEAKTEAENETRSEKDALMDQEVHAHLEDASDAVNEAKIDEAYDMGADSAAKSQQLVSRLAGVVRTFTEREKATGGASKGARRAIAGIEYLNTRPELLKEMADMPMDELTKALDELGAARLAAEKAAKKAKAKKEAKKDPDYAAKREAKKTAKAAEQAAKAAQDPTADLRDTVTGLAKTVEALASQDGKRIVTSAGGLTAALRSPEGPTIFKGFEDAVAEAEARLEKAVGDGITRASMALRQARQQRDTAKMIMAEHGRAADGPTLAHMMRGGGVPLFKEIRQLPDDTGIRYQ